MRIQRTSKLSPKAPSRRAFLGGCAGAGVGLVAAGRGDGADGVGASGEAAAWPERRERIARAWLDLLGPFPAAAPELEPEMRRAEDIEGIECRYVTFQVEPGERVPGYLLIPESARRGASPAVVTIHPTTQGSGKRIAVGLSGRKPEDPPLPPAESRAYGLELARWGYVTLSIDLICDGERIPDGLPCYDTSAFYDRHPEWSAVGKNTWDLMRAVDFLHTLDFVDPARIACCGHSLGGHSSLFAAAFDGRIAAVCNGGVYGWRREEDHWSRPPRKDPASVSGYIYLKRFRPYLEDLSRPVPTDFDELMMLAAPRPLLIMQTEEEMARDGAIEKAARASEVYRELRGGDRIALFSYPGPHNYPPDAKRLSFAWLDRWLGHTPAVPTIWREAAV